MLVRDNLQRKAKKNPVPVKQMLSVVVPVYNEAPHLQQAMEGLLSFSLPVKQEWIVVDDGSTDHSWEILQSLRKKYSFVLLRQKVNQGKSAAVIRAFGEARGDFVLIQDADFEYDPADVPRLLQPLLRDEADVVYGSRFLAGGRKGASWLHYRANRLFTFINNMLGGVHTTDVYTCYKLLRTDLIRAMQLRAGGFSICLEISALVGKTQARFVELPISYTPRSREEGKKIAWRDGFRTLAALVFHNVLRSRRSVFKKLPAKYGSYS